MNEINEFTIRVYGIFLNENQEVLLSDEYQFDMKITKFPGGGLEFYEGPVDCLKRECMEELGQEIEVIRHFYTTDFFQPGYFRKNVQVISIYYLARFTGPVRFNISEKPFDFEEMVNGNQSFRWKNISELRPDEITLPIDKIAAEKLIREFKTNLS
jgi:8-oxo-dGTP diphosphatase